jgi:hypothetical protein
MIIAYLHRYLYGYGFFVGHRNATHTHTHYTCGKNPHRLPIPVHITNSRSCFVSFPAY